MISPYSDTFVPIGLQNQVITLFRMDEPTKKAFIDLVEAVSQPSNIDLYSEDADKEITFDEEYASVCAFYKEADANKLFHAYEALYTLVQAKRATERALKDNNAAVIKSQLEEIAKYSFELESEPKEMMALTAQQTEQLKHYLEKLKEYEQIFTNFKFN